MAPEVERITVVSRARWENGNVSKEALFDSEGRLFMIEDGRESDASEKSAPRRRKARPRSRGRPRRDYIATAPQVEDGSWRCIYPGCDHEGTFRTKAALGSHLRRAHKIRGKSATATKYRERRSA